MQMNGTADAQAVHAVNLQVHVQLQLILTTNGHSSRLSWYQANIWNTRPIFLSLQGNYIQSVIYSYSCYWALPMLSLLSPNPEVLGTIYYCLIWYWVPFCRVSRLAGLPWKYSDFHTKLIRTANRSIAHKVFTMRHHELVVLSGSEEERLGLLIENIGHTTHQD
jgi:hypothetical protein